MGLVNTSVYSAIGDGPAGGTNNLGETIDDTYVPIDGGIISVTGLAIAYGMKRRKKKRNVNMP
jgi:hypothetical protein